MIVLKRQLASDINSLQIKEIFLQTTTYQDNRFSETPLKASL